MRLETGGPYALAGQRSLSHALMVLHKPCTAGAHENLKDPDLKAILSQEWTWKSHSIPPCGLCAGNRAAMPVHRLRPRPPAPSTFHKTPPRQWPDITPLPGRVFTSAAFPENSAAERLASTSEILFRASARPAPTASRPAASSRGSAPPSAPHRPPEPPSSIDDGHGASAQTENHPAPRSPATLPARVAPPQRAAPPLPQHEAPHEALHPPSAPSQRPSTINGSGSEEEEDNSPESAYSRAAFRARQERAGQAGGGMRQERLFGGESPHGEMQHERHGGGGREGTNTHLPRGSVPLGARAPRGESSSQGLGGRIAGAGSASPGQREQHGGGGSSQARGEWQEGVRVALNPKRSTRSPQPSTVNA